MYLGPIFVNKYITTTTTTELRGLRTNDAPFEMETFCFTGFKIISPENSGPKIRDSLCSGHFQIIFVSMVLQFKGTHLRSADLTPVVRTKRKIAVSL